MKKVHLEESWMEPNSAEKPEKGFCFFSIKTGVNKKGESVYNVIWCNISLVALLEAICCVCTHKYLRVLYFFKKLLWGDFGDPIAVFTVYQATLHADGSETCVKVDMDDITENAISDFIFGKYKEIYENE